MSADNPGDDASTTIGVLALLSPRLFVDIEADIAYVNTERHE